MRIMFGYVIIIIFSTTEMTELFGETMNIVTFLT